MHWVLYVGVFYAGLATAQVDFTTKRWFIDPHQVLLKEGEVRALSNQGHQVVGSVSGQDNANLYLASQGNYHAGRDNGKVEAQSADGQVVNAEHIPEANGERTLVNGAGHAIELKRVENGKDRSIFSSLDDTHNLAAFARDNFKTFDASNSDTNDKVAVLPDTQTETRGSGVIVHNNDVFNYQNSHIDGSASAKLDNVGPRHKTYTCKAHDRGVASCADHHGLKVGEVISKADGTVFVKKSIARGVDVPVGKAKVRELPQGGYVASINDDLFEGVAGNYKQRDCTSDFQHVNLIEQIKIEGPFTFKYHSEQTTPEGQRLYQWPDCVTFSGSITLPPGLDVNRLAAQFDARILPIGKLRCVDNGNCGRDCYYCNICRNNRKVDLLANAYSPNLCNAKGGSSYVISFTACPFPKDFHSAFCSGFVNSDPSYFLRKGDLQARIIFYERPPNEDQLRKEFFQKVAQDSTGAWKQSFIVQYKSDQNNVGRNVPPTDFDLEEWYIQQNGGKGSVVGCIEGTTNYTLRSSKQVVSFLLEPQSAQPRDVDTESCPDVDHVKQEQADQDRAEVGGGAAPTQKPKPVTAGKPSTPGGPPTPPPLVRLVSLTHPPPPPTHPIHPTKRPGKPGHQKEWTPHQAVTKPPNRGRGRSLTNTTGEDETLD